MINFFSFVNKKNLNKVISVYLYFNKYIIKFKIIKIIKKKIFFFDKRNESIEKDFIIIKFKLKKNKLRNFFFIKILKLNKILL